MVDVPSVVVVAAVDAVVVAAAVVVLVAAAPVVAPLPAGVVAAVFAARCYRFLVGPTTLPARYTSYATVYQVHSYSYVMYCSRCALH